jgi:hypothetical protein
MWYSGIVNGNCPAHLIVSQETFYNGVFMKAEYIKLVDLILSRGHCVSVDTGGDEPDVIQSTNRAEILEAIESVDMAELSVYEPCGGDGDKAYWLFVFWAMIIPFGVAPDESVADFTDNGYWLEEIV